MNKIYISSADLSYSILLPVTPADIPISESMDIKKYTTVNGENKSLPGHVGLCQASFSSHFPATARDYATGSTLLGIDCVRAIERFYKQGIVCRLTITGMGFDRLMMIEKFEYSAKQGNDIDYSITFTEKR